MYAKMNTISTPSQNEGYKTETNSYGTAVYFMTFSENHEYLLIYY